MSNTRPPLKVGVPLSPSPIRLWSFLVTASSGLIVAIHREPGQAALLPIWGAIRTS